MKNFTLKNSLMLSAFFLLSNAFAQKDTIPPSIEINWTDTLCIQIGNVWVEKLIISDNQSDMSSITVSKTWGFNGPVNTMIRKSYPVQYEATDSNGNKRVLNIVYRVDDCIPPQISLNTADTVCHRISTPYNSVAATVSDNYYSQGQVSLIRIFSNVNPNVAGLYTEVYEAVDGSGNKTQKTRWVKVGQCNTSGLDLIGRSLINVYPNPVNDILNITLNETVQADYSIYTLDGRLVQSDALESGGNTVSVTTLAPGVYTLQINTGFELVNLKILVNPK